MAVDVVTAVRLELLDELRAPRHRERAAHTDVLEVARVVVEAEQQRADRIGPRLCQRNPATTQSAVRSCLIFSIARTSGW